MESCLRDDLEEEAALINPGFCVRDSALAEADNDGIPDIDDPMPLDRDTNNRMDHLESAR